MNNNDNSSRALRILVLMTITVTFVTACRSGSDNGVETGSGYFASAATPTMLNGVASKGLLNSASICAYAITSSGEKGARIGSCTASDANGNYSINLGTYTGPVLAVATGGTYVNEATGATNPLTLPLTSMLPNAAAGSNSLAITALTELAYMHASAFPGGLSAVNMLRAITTVQNNFGVPDIVYTMPVNALNVPDSSTTAQLSYTLALATFSQYMHQQPGGSTLAGTLQTLEDCLAAPTVGCGTGSTSVGALLNNSLTRFVANNPAYKNLASSTRRVVFFGKVTILPADGTTGATGNPDPGITWVDSISSSVLAVSNTGYMADDGASMVTITLSESLNVGDIIQVNGRGAGGWTIKGRNDRQVIVAQDILNIPDAPTATKIVGQQYDAIELQYVGDNTFSVLNFAGNLEVGLSPDRDISDPAPAWSPYLGGTGRTMIFNLENGNATSSVSTAKNTPTCVL